MRKLFSKKNTLLVLFVVFFCLVLFGYIAGRCVAMHACEGRGVNLFFYGILFSILKPTLTILSGILPISLSFFFIRDQIFYSWLKFVKWYLPLSALIIFISPTHGHGFLPPLVTKELASLWLAGLFVVVSIVLIVYKYFSLPKSERRG